MSFPPLCIQIGIFRPREVKQVVQNNTAEKQRLHLKLYACTGGHISIRRGCGFLEAEPGFAASGQLGSSLGDFARTSYVGPCQGLVVSGLGILSDQE